MNLRLLFSAWLGLAALGQADSFDKDKLVAWCIVPFDAKNRTPAERVQMLKELGLKRVAYDWRAKHVAEFEEEILQYKKNDIEFFAFWSTHPEAFRLFKKYNIRPQIWHTASSPINKKQQTKIDVAVQGLLPLVEQTRKLGSKLGLYNHGGWGGEPKNLIAVCESLRKHHNADHVGIVYNLHHGHDQMRDFGQSLKAMQPYLLCLNLNGMNDGAKPKILPLGQGQNDARLIRVIRDSGYKGPIGILDHRSDTDAKVALQQNLSGLKKILAESK